MHPKAQSTKQKAKSKKQKAKSKKQKAKSKEQIANSKNKKTKTLWLPSPATKLSNSLSTSQSR